MWQYTRERVLLATQNGHHDLRTFFNWFALHRCIAQKIGVPGFGKTSVTTLQIWFKNRRVKARHHATNQSLQYDKTSNSLAYQWTHKPTQCYNTQYHSTEAMAPCNLPYTTACQWASETTFGNIDWKQSTENTHVWIVKAHGAAFHLALYVDSTHTRYDTDDYWW